jgi:hypothetical protein
MDNRFFSSVKLQDKPTHPPVQGVPVFIPGVTAAGNVNLTTRRCRVARLRKCGLYLCFSIRFPGVERGTLLVKVIKKINRDFGNT